MFITFEGIDGCGKSTQVKKFTAYLKKNKIKMITTREPGGTNLAEKIRKIILNRNNRTMTWKTELLLYMASRSQHVEEKIRPALKNGSIVVSDRFSDATMSYQGYGRGLDRESIATLNSFATTELKPDLTYILDLPVSAARKRISTSRRSLDRMEQEGDSFQRKVRKGYRAAATAEPGRCVIINASRSAEVIHDNIVQIFERFKDKLTRHTIRGIKSKTRIRSHARP